MSKLTELSEAKSTDNDFTKKPAAPTKGTSTTHKGGTKTVDEKGTKHKGKYGTEFQGDDEVDEKGKKKKAAPVEKKGRGRPTKPENKAEKDKPDFSAFGAKKNVKLKPWDKKATTKHSLKDWIENLDKALNEDGQGQLQVKPLPGASQITNAKGDQVGVASDPATAALVSKASNDGKLTLGGEMDEGAEGGGETINTYFAWRVACRKAGGKSFTGGRVHDECHDASGQCVGEWKNSSGTLTCGADNSPALAEAKKAKPDFLDKDKDGNKKEPFKKAIKDTKKPVEEGKMKDLSMDLGNKKDRLPDAEFKKKYGKSKVDMKKSMSDSKNTTEKKPVKESILRESHDTMQHIIDSHKNEVKKFINGEDLDEHLYDALYDYYCNQGEMPYGTMKARTGDPFEWVTQRFDTDVHDYNLPGGHPEGDMMGMDEGQFTQHYMDANKPAPTNPAPTPWARDPIAALTDRTYDKVADPFGDKPLADNIQFEGWQKELDGILNEGINITANTGLGDGPDSVTISATEEDAQQLLDIVKSAGLGMFAGGEQDQSQQSDGVGFAGDAIEHQRDGNTVDVSASEPEVVDDQDGMMDLIKRMTGGGSPQNQTQSGSQETDEGCGIMDEEDSSEGNEAQRATEKLETVHDAWSEVDGSDEGNPDAAADGQGDDVPGDFEGDDEGEVAESNELDICPNCNGSGEGQYEGARCSSCKGSGEVSHDEDPGEEHEEPDWGDERNRTDEGYANDADKAFIADIEFMTKGLSGGLNNNKKTQSVGAPVTIASTPLKETTDLLADYRKLAGN